jgi:hypothetical protein
MEYLDILRKRTQLERFAGVEIGNHDIKWNIIDDDLISIEKHGTLPGLIVADAVASSFFSALQFTP